MAIHDLDIRTGGAYNTIGKSPYFRTCSFEYNSSAPITYLNNSLEGHLFDDNGSGGVNYGTNVVFPNFNFMDTTEPNTPSVAFKTMTDVYRTNNIVTITISSHGLVVNDIFSLTGIGIGELQTSELNGVFKVFQVVDSNTFKFICYGEDFVKSDVFGEETSLYVYLFKYSNPVFKIYDNRDVSSSSGLSYTSVFLTSKFLCPQNPSDGYYRKRIVPSDFYIRFKITNYNETATGINSNIFNVIDENTSENIKPIIWAYFFGGLTKVNDFDFNSSDRTPNNIFDIIFNSYALVLRPSGVDSYLEFALLKFSWGEITSANWFTSFIDTPLINRYDSVSGTDLGYLISTNPNVSKLNGVSKISELAVSDAFYHNSDEELKLNLKISVRKHLLTDQSNDDTYYFQLAVNTDYDSFGDSFVYSNVMHSYIARPKHNGFVLISFQSSGYEGCSDSDIGKDVVDSLSNVVGKLFWFNNDDRVWWLKETRMDVNSGVNLSIDSGDGAGITNSKSYIESALRSVIPVSTNISDKSNYLLLPWMYFKFVNTNSTQYREESSKIVVENILFRQLNSSNSALF